MSDENFSIMGALRQGKTDADTITQIGGGFGKGVFGIVKIALCLPIMMSFGIDGLLRHSFGSRYFSIMTWLASLIGFVVFAAIFVTEDEASAIESVMMLIFFSGPAHLIHWIVRVRRFQLHSGFAGVSWVPWHKLPWRVGYWQPLCVFDPMLACGVGWIITAIGFGVGWYLFVGGIVSSLRHTYFFLVDHSRRVDQRDAMIEASVNIDSAHEDTITLEANVAVGTSGQWLH